MIDSGAASTAGLSLVSTFVLSGAEPLRLVIHHDDDTWDFLCGTTADARHLTTIHTDECSPGSGPTYSHSGRFPLVTREREGRGNGWRVQPYVEQD